MHARFTAFGFSLILFPLAASAQLYWDGATPAGAPGGGAGTWNTTLQNWDASLAGSDIAWPTGGSGAVFGGVGGTVLAGASFTQALGRPVSELTFAASGYTLNTSGASVDVVSGIRSTLAGNVFSLSGTSGALSVSGAGNLTANQTITINSGRLAVQMEDGGFPIGAAGILLNGGNLTFRRDGAPDATLEEFGVPQIVTVAGNSTIFTDRLTASGGTGKRIVIPSIVLGANTLTLSSLNNYSIEFSNMTLTGSGTISNAADVVFRSLAGGANKLTKLGNGTLFIDGNTTLGGGLDILTATVEGRRAGSFGTGVVSLGTGGTPASGSASLGLDAAGAFANSVVVGGAATGTRTLFSSGRGAVLTGSVAMNRSLVLSADDGADLALQGVLSGAFSITKRGLGTIALENTGNSFGTGTASAITLNNGFLAVPADAALGDIANGVTFTGTSTTNPAGLRFTDHGATSRVLTFTNAANRIEVDAGKSFALNAPTTGAGSFRKGGEGALVLNAIPGHSGSTAVESGELKAATLGGAYGALSLEGGLMTFAPVSATASTATFSPSSLTYDSLSTLRLSIADLTPDGFGNRLTTLATATLNRSGSGVIYLSSDGGLAALGTANGGKWTVRGKATTDFFSGSVIGMDADTPHVLAYDSVKGVVSASPSYVPGFDPLRSDEIVNGGIDQIVLEVDETALAFRSDYTSIYIGSSEIGGLFVPATLTLGRTGESGMLITTFGGYIGGEGTLSTSNREMVVYVGQSQEPGADPTETIVESRIIAIGGIVKCGPGVFSIGYSEFPHSIGPITVQEGTFSVPDGSTVLNNYSVKLGQGTLRVEFGEFGRPIILSGSDRATLGGSAESVDFQGVISGGPNSPEAVGLRVAFGDVLLSNLANSFTGNIRVEDALLRINAPGSADPTALGSGEKEVILSGTEYSGFLAVGGDFNPPANTKRFRVVGPDSTIYTDGAFTTTLDDPNQLSGDGGLTVSGNLIVQNQPHFTGDVSVRDGIFDLRGSLPGQIYVLSTMTFTSSGLGIQGPVIIDAAGTLTGTGTLANTLTLNGIISPGGVEIAEIRATEIVQGATAKTVLTLGNASDRIAAIGNLELGGKLRIAAGPGFGAGSYTIATYGGTLAGALTIENAPPGFTYQFSSATVGEVRLIVTATQTFAEWQIANFGSVTLPAAQDTADPDGDGQTNEVEFQAGTNPNNGASVFASKVTKVSGGFTLSWPGSSGRSYIVEAKNTLSAASWATLGTVAAATAPETTYTDFTVLPVRFYRVRVAP